MENYRAVMAPATLKIYWLYFWNTVIVGISAAVATLSCSVPLAFAITRYSFVGRRVIQHVALVGYVVPPMLLVLPYAKILAAVGLYDTLFGVTAATVAFCLPFGIWLTVRYFDAVPRELDAAAALDGAAWWQRLAYIILPSTVSGVVAIAVFTFVLAWNDVALSLFLASESNRTLAAGVNESILRTDASRYGEFAAASVVIVAIAMLVASRGVSWADPSDAV